MNKPETEYQRILRLLSQIKMGDIKAVMLFNRAMYNLTKRSIDNPERAVYTNVYMPSEIFYAMDLPTLYVEYNSGTMSAVRKSIELLEVVEQTLPSSGMCAVITAAIGMFENGHLPPPKFFIAPSEICEDSMKLFEYLSKKYNTNYFHIDAPFSHDDKTVDYVAGQFEEMVDMLEKHTGEKLDYSKLEEAIRLSNEAREIGLKIRKLRSESPPLMHGVSGIQLMSINALFGSQDAVDVLNHLYDELLENKKNGDGPLKDAKYRVYWAQHFPTYAVSLLNYLENELGVAIVGEEIMDVPKIHLDEKEPIRSMAKKLLSHPAHGPVENRVRNIMDGVVEFKADAIINYSPLNCRLGRAAVRFLKDEADKLEIPFIDLIGDTMDYRNYSQSQMETRLDAFVELIKSQRE